MGAQVALKEDSLEHRLLKQAGPKIARQAGIPIACLYTSMEGQTSTAEVEYVRNYRRQAKRGIWGLVLHGPSPKGKPIFARLALMAGAFTRNFILAKIMPLQDVLLAEKDGEMPAPSVLLIPNFCAKGGKASDWEVTRLFSLLVRRSSCDQQTVLYVESLEVLKQVYGPDIYQHLTTGNFVLVPADDSEDREKQ